MIKINPDAVLERETSTVRSNRAVCIGLKQTGVKLWLKGKRDFFTVSYEDLYQFAIRQEQRGVYIPARKVSDAKVEKAHKAIEANMPRTRVLEVIREFVAMVEDDSICVSPSNRERLIALLTRANQVLP